MDVPAQSYYIPLNPALYEPRCRGTGATRKTAISPTAWWTAGTTLPAWWRRQHWCLRKSTGPKDYQAQVPQPGDPLTDCLGCGLTLLICFGGACSGLSSPACDGRANLLRLGNLDYPQVPPPHPKTARSSTGIERCLLSKWSGFRVPPGRPNRPPHSLTTSQNPHTFPGVAGFVVSGHFTAYHDIPTKGWYFCRYLYAYQLSRYQQQRHSWHLPTPFVKNVKPAGSHGREARRWAGPVPAHVKPAGRVLAHDYRHLGNAETRRLACTRVSFARLQAP